MRAAIFIDGGYFLKQLQDARIEPNYQKLADHFLAPIRSNTPVDLLRCYFYYCAPYMSLAPTDDELRRMAEHQKFVAEIESLDRWQFRLGKLEKRREGGKDVFSQKRVDVLLSVDLVRHAAAGHIQHAIIVAGDSDFIPAVNAAKQSGVTITLWCGKDRSPHKDLIVQADEVQYLNWRTFPRFKKSTRKGDDNERNESGKKEENGKNSDKKREIKADSVDQNPEDSASKKNRRRRGGSGRKKKLAKAVDAKVE